MEPDECQFASLQSIAEGNAPMPRQPFIKTLKFFIRDHMSEKDYAILRKYYHSLTGFFFRKKSKQAFPAKPVTYVQSQPLKAGDMVRVRSKDEIEAMLDNEGKTRGCGFMDGQWGYCGTVQRVFKPMERFVDERDGRVKKCSGLILLENVVCEGVKAYGRCDRSCLMFWREEWLEKIQ